MQFVVLTVKYSFVATKTVFFDNYTHVKLLNAILNGVSQEEQMAIGSQWKWELQFLANETGLTMHVLHFPAGTSKWNKIEHKLFSFISQNWQGVALQTYGIILGLIGGTTTKTGLSVTAQLDTGTYELHKRPMELLHLP